MMIIIFIYCSWTTITTCHLLDLVLLRRSFFAAVVMMVILMMMMMSIARGRR